MKNLVVVLIAVVLLPVLAAGCGGGDKDKGINSNKDMPKADKNR